MNIMQCKICAKPFQSMGGAICGNCLMKIEEEFVKIKDYLYDHPGNIGAAELAEVTEVDRVIIDFLIKEERIILSHSVGKGPFCTVCNKPISSGSLCESCRNDISNKLSSTLPKPPEKPKTVDRAIKDARMHVRGRE